MNINFCTCLCTYALISPVNIPRSRIAREILYKKVYVSLWGKLANPCVKCLHGSPPLFMSHEEEYNSSTHSMTCNQQLHHFFTEKWLIWMITWGWGPWIILLFQSWFLLLSATDVRILTTLIIWTQGLRAIATCMWFSHSDFLFLTFEHGP